MISVAKSTAIHLAANDVQSTGALSGAAELIDEKPVHKIILGLSDAASADPVTIDTLLRTLNTTTQAVLLLIPALVLVSPLSGLPGMATIGGLMITLVSFQIMLGRPVIWLPRFVLQRRLPAEKLARALIHLERAARVIDRNTKPRMRWFFVTPGRQLAQATCLACGLAMPFLELVPFSATTLGLVVVILSVSLIVRDGLLAAGGLCCFGVAIVTIAKLVSL